MAQESYLLFTTHNWWIIIQEVPFGFVETINIFALPKNKEDYA